MCGRFVAAADPDQLAAWFDVDERYGDPVPPSWNVAPTMPVHAVAEHAGQRALTQFRWGLVPSWSDDAKGGARMINARRESVANRPAYRSALQRRRCLIPADGFYEWQRDGDTKIPYYVHGSDDGPLALAGLWEVWRAPDDTRLRTCVIITTAARDGLEQVHNRMPVVLPHTTWQRWLDRDTQEGDAALAVLDESSAMPVRGSGNGHGLAWHPVATDVNHVRNDHAGLIALAANTPHGATPSLDLG